MEREKSRATDGDNMERTTVSVPVEELQRGVDGAWTPGPQRRSPTHSILEPYAEQTSHQRRVESDRRSVSFRFTMYLFMLQRQQNPRANRHCPDKKQCRRYSRFLYRQQRE